MQLINTLDTFLNICQDAYDSGVIVRRWWDDKGHIYAIAILHLAIMTVVAAAPYGYKAYRWAKPAVVAEAARIQKDWPACKDWYIHRFVQLKSVISWVWVNRGTAIRATDKALSFVFQTA